MQDHAANQIEQIHSMLATGHRSVRLEKHTLIIWGLTAAFLILSVNAIFTPKLIPGIWPRALASNLFIATVVIFAAYWDFRLTRQQREQNDETLSFIQLQLTKVWWSLVGLIVLINLGMNFFGGGYLFYPIMIALTGLGFYIHGLFSQQLLTWNGTLMVLIGLTCLILQMPLKSMEWLTIILAGIGLPVLAWLIDLPIIQQKLRFRMLASLLWLSLIILPTWLIHQAHYRAPTPDWPTMTLQDYQLQKRATPDKYVLQIPAGTDIPLELNIRGETLTTQQQITIPLTLKRPLDLTVKQSKPDGRYRFEQGKWLHPLRKYRFREYQLAPELNHKDGIKLKMGFIIETLER
ncbi:MAG: hypothetical protein OEZ33_10230 [Gammaproteobacteria bacterium]|nr:hypothetical protein [Gammaproteobacteria bacterium]MDH5778580.1 hypothetical protein [Gammaproteobacteria bacterium]